MPPSPSTEIRVWISNYTPLYDAGVIACPRPGSDLIVVSESLSTKEANWESIEGGGGVWGGGVGVWGVGVWGGVGVGVWVWGCGCGCGGVGWGGGGCHIWQLH